MTVLWVFQPSLLFSFVCSLLVFRTAFHHPSHCRAAHKIFPSAGWQRASFFFLWVMQLYQYLPNNGTVNAHPGDDIWYCFNIAEKWIMPPRWVLFSLPTQQVSSTDKSGFPLRPKTNPDWCFPLLLPSCSSCPLITWVVLLGVHILHQSIAFLLIYSPNNQLIWSPLSE